MDLRSFGLRLVPKATRVCGLISSEFGEGSSTLPTSLRAKRCYVLVFASPFSLAGVRYNAKADVNSA